MASKIVNKKLSVKKIKKHLSDASQQGGEEEGDGGDGEDEGAALGGGGRDGDGDGGGDGDGDGGVFSVIFKEIDIVALSPSNSKDVLKGAGWGEFRLLVLGVRFLQRLLPAPHHLDDDHHSDDNNGNGEDNNDDYDDHSDDNNGNGEDNNDAYSDDNGHHLALLALAMQGEGSHGDAVLVEVDTPGNDDVNEDDDDDREEGDDDDREEDDHKIWRKKTSFRFTQWVILTPDWALNPC